MKHKVQPLRIALIEPGVSQLALALARAGQPVTLIDTDPHDLRRLREMLPRLAGTAGHLIELSNDVSAANTADCVLASCDIGTVCTDWTASVAMPVLHLAQCPRCAPIVEQIGDDDTGHVAQIAVLLNAYHGVLPSGAIPLSVRFQVALSHIIEGILMTDLTPAEIDEALENAGFAIGPFEAQDEIGIDTVLLNRRVVDGLQQNKALPLFERAVAEGRLGRKASVGWYRYPGQSGKVEDPLVEDMAFEEAHFAGHTRRAMKASEVVERVQTGLDALCAQLSNEGYAHEVICEIASRSIGHPVRP
ncbi:MAG: 3-hydroxyacyl-CoA dehydrogenase family protein [Aliishimia sp.]